MVVELIHVLITLIDDTIPLHLVNLLREFILLLSECLNLEQPCPWVFLVYGDCFLDSGVQILLIVLKLVVVSRIHLLEEGLCLEILAHAIVGVNLESCVKVSLSVVHLVKAQLQYSPHAEVPWQATDMDCLLYFSECFVVILWLVWFLGLLNNDLCLWGSKVNVAKVPSLIVNPPLFEIEACRVHLSVPVSQVVSDG